MHWPDDAAFDADLRSALTLDADESAYLATLNLSTAWQTASAPPADWPKRLTWLSLAFVAATMGTWLVAVPLLTPLLDLLAQLGAGAILLRLLLSVLWTAGESLLVLASHPSLGFAIPALAVIGLLLLAWPRSLTRTNPIPV
jgi:hypothetical protein